jgi:hypothetical protein
MAVTTNLSVFDAADSSGKWAELAGHLSGGAPAATSENYWQNGTAVDQSTGQAVGTSAGMQCDFGSTLSWTGSSKWVFLTWSKYDAATNIQTWANGGFRIGIGTSSGNMDFVNAYGSDFSPYPAGGWISVAIDPEVAFASPDASDGSGLTSGSYRVIGFLPNTLAKVTKGSPIVADIIRYGRGDIVVTGTETFSSMATADNTATVRWGLFIPKATGIYEWKGLMSLGTSGTAVSLTDANKTILVQDTPRVSAGFNKIEVSNASSTVSLDSVTIQGVQTSITGSSPISPGDFEAVANANITFTSCTFVDLGTFIFQSNSEIIGSIFRRCEAITQGGATFTDCFFINSAASTALTVNDASVVTGCTFVGNGTTSPGHAVDLGTINTGGSVTINWTNELDNGTTNQSVWEGSTQSPTAGTQGSANSAITVNVVSGTALKIAVGSGATIPTVQNTGTGTLEITANEVTLTITVQDIITNSPIEGAMVYCRNSGATATYINKVETNSSGQVSFTGSLGSAQTLAGSVRAATPDTHAYSKHYKSSPIVGTFSNLNDTNITISLIPDE